MVNPRRSYHKVTKIYETHAEVTKKLEWQFPGFLVT
jgi:hypothetical protein